MVSKCALSDGSRTSWNNLTFGTHVGFISLGCYGVCFSLSSLKRKLSGLHLKHLCPHGVESSFLTETTKCIRFDGLCENNLQTDREKLNLLNHRYESDTV